MGKKTRQELSTEFKQELYLSASFFKMKTTGSKAVDQKVHEVVPQLPPMPHPKVVTKHVSQREAWPKFHPSHVHASTAEQAIVGLHPEVLHWIEMGDLDLTYALVLSRVQPPEAQLDFREDSILLNLGEFGDKVKAYLKRKQNDEGTADPR